MLVFYDEIFLTHIPPEMAHPETPERLQILYNATLELIEEHGNIIEVKKPTYNIEDIPLLVHDKEYYNMIKEYSSRISAEYLDLDTYICSNTFKAAVKASSTVVEAVDLILQGRVSKVFCLIRPPGHHATKNKAGGFCIFNNVAIGAEYALKHGLKKIAILDLDAHHGNGTQEIFYERQDVLYVSIHQYGIYPGTGWYDELGKAEGLGYNINIPLPAFASDDIYIKALDIASRIISQFKPDLLLVSLGFDTLKKDPLTDLMLTTEFFQEIGRRLAEIRDKIILVLEGGYHLQSMKKAYKNLIKGLLNLAGRRITAEKSIEEAHKRFNKIVTEALKAFSEYWNL